jgi:uncharacterized protein YcfJ
MKKNFILTIITFGFASFANATDFFDYAIVKSVEPQYISINQPIQKCTTQPIQETIPARTDKSYEGAVIGGIAGGLIGNQIGKGHGKEAATAIGAVVGALTGDNLDNRNNYVPPQTITKEVQHCYLEDNYIQKINNYKITYEYKGRIDTFISSIAPNTNKIRVNININPVIENSSSYYSY